MELRPYKNSLRLLEVITGVMLFLVLTNSEALGSVYDKTCLLQQEANSIACNLPLSPSLEVGLFIDSLAALGVAGIIGLEISMSKKD